MSYAKPSEKRREYQRRLDVKLLKRESERRHRNERNSKLGWLWLGWSQRFRKALRFDYGMLSIVSLEQLQKPTFIVVHRGQRQRETLC